MGCCLFGEFARDARSVPASGPQVSVSIGGAGIRKVAWVAEAAPLYSGGWGLIVDILIPAASGLVCQPI